MFLAAGCATSISRRMAFPSFVNLGHLLIKARDTKCKDLQDSTHGVKNHL